MFRPQPISISPMYTDSKSLPPGGGRDIWVFHATFHEHFISSKHHLGNFIGADVLKEPGFYHLQESCLVEVPNSGDFLCELQCGSCWCGSPLKNHHRQSQTRFLTPHHGLSIVLTTSHPDTSISVHQPPDPGAGINTQSLTSCSRNWGGFHPSWVLTHRVELQFLLSDRIFRDQVLIWMGNTGKGFLGNTNTDLFQKVACVLCK